MQSWLRSTMSRQRLEGEMEEEIRFHLEARAADLARIGMMPKQAMRQARLEFGGIASHKDNMRRSLGLRWWDELRSDALYASRILRKSPGFTLIAVLSLALAIGANTTVFSFANAMLFERLGVPHPEQLRLLTLRGDANVLIPMSWGSAQQLPGGSERFDSFTYPVYQQLKAQNRVLEDIFAFKDLGRVNASVDGNPQPATAELVSGSFFEQMRVQPILGRAILPADDGAPGTGAVVVISDRFWSSMLGRALGAIGKIISADNTPMTIVGISPRGFTGAVSAQQSPDFFIPLSMLPLLRAPVHNAGAYFSTTTFWWLQLMARMKPGVSEEQARLSLDLLLNAAVRGTTVIEKDRIMPHIMIEDGSRGLNEAAIVAKPINVLLAMVGGVLLLACANIANLMLARASNRKREMTVRLALGASRGRILRQVLTESLVLASMGGLLGLLVGLMSRARLPGLFTSSWKGSELQIPFDWKIFVFNAAITIGTGIVFGLLPAFAATRTRIHHGLKQGNTTITRRRKGLSGQAIVLFQVALSTLLLVAAGLFLQTLAHLRNVDPGFQTSRLILFDINPPDLRYPYPKDVSLHLRLEDSIATLPGVERVSTTVEAPLSGRYFTGGFFVEDESRTASSSGTTDLYPSMAWVGRTFFSVMKIPIVAGRNFDEHETETSPRAAIINQALARKFFPHQNPIGKRFSVGNRSHLNGVTDRDNQWIEIIGVCADARLGNLRDEPPPMDFQLYSQRPNVGSLTYIVRTQMDAGTAVPALRQIVRRIDPELPLTDVRTQDQQVDDLTRQERMFASLTSGFGLLALILACVGIYGVMAYTVAQRTNEIGIRLALGAERATVRRMVLREAASLAVIGVISGLMAALSLGRLVRSMLYGLQPADPLSLASAGCLLLCVALAAGWIPAMRASRVEPIEALQHE